MNRPIIAITLLLSLGACAGVDTSGTVDKALTRVNTATNALLERRTAADLELVKEADALAEIARRQADRFDQAKCQMSLPAIRAYADVNEDNRKALSLHCGIDVERGAAVLR